MLKNFTSLLTSVALLFSVTACAQMPASGSAAQSGSTVQSKRVPASSSESVAGSAPQQDETISASDGNTLVVYFSWSGNTEEMAIAIAEQTGADLLRLEPADPYPEDYSATGDRAKIEVDTNARPEIANLPGSVSEYHTILVGYPIWWHTAPMLIGTFLESYDLSGVDIYPFTQSASMDEEQFAQSMDLIRTSAANATVHDGLFCRPSDTNGIRDYLQQNGLLKDAQPSAQAQAEPLKEIPGEYLLPAQEQGTVVRLDYQSNTYDETNKVLSKFAYVYLPYGYEENDTQTQYNVFYLMHGGGGTAERYLGGENGDAPLKRILDHMIENGEIEPMIVVTPTFYPDNRSGPEAELTANFHNELILDLIPAVESRYHTYAASTDQEGLQASREHRIFGGFSMGSVTTWYTFIDGLDYFKYYIPISGDCWLFGQMGGSDSDYSKTAVYLNQLVQDSGYSPEDYMIYAATGTDDIAYPALSKQVEAMKVYPETFVYDPDLTKGNFYYGVVEGGVHNNTYMNQYIYNALPALGVK